MPIKVRWWQKLVTKPKPMPSRQIQNWRNLSPDEPPLPFFAAAITTVAHKVAQTPIKFSELDSNTSEIAPIHKVKIMNIDLWFKNKHFVFIRTWISSLPLRFIYHTRSQHLVEICT